jgi:ubiquinol-cytochrome c reductase cytochrome b subunit
VILPILGVVEKPHTPPATIEADFLAHYGPGEEGMERGAISKPAE